MKALPPKQKLWHMLKKKGYVVYSWKLTMGAWRRMDCHRWEALCTHLDRPGETLNLMSYHTITECVRNGFDITPDSYTGNGYYVDARPKRKKID